MQEIIIINQSHPNSGLNKKINKSKPIYPNFTAEEERLFKLIAKNQYDIAKFIEKNPDIPVILENSKALSHGEHPEWDDFVSKLFPDGLSNISFKELDFNQEAFLAMRGGCHYAVFKKIIDQTYSDHPDLIAKTSFKTIEKIQENKDVEYSEKIKMTALHNQMREYLALQNADEVLRKTGSNRVIMAYGPSHSFEDVRAACFPHLTLRTMDMSNRAKAKQFEQKFISDLLSNRLPVNCSHLALGPNMPLSLPVSNNGAANLSSDHAMSYGTIALTGLALFGMFRYCLSRSKQNAPQQVTANSKQADQTNSDVTSKQSSRHKLKRT